MELITQILVPVSALPEQAIVVPVDRLTLSKRRWRGSATDGREFGFDLEQPLRDGDPIFADESAVYRLEQQPEEVLSIDLGPAPDAARLGWLLGNLHFRIAVADGSVQVPDDPAVRQLLEREHIHFHRIKAVFRPLGGGHAHGPAYSH